MAEPPPMPPERRAEIQMIPAGAMNKSQFERRTDGRWLADLASSTSAVPLWLWWAETASEHAIAAREARPSDEYIDAIGRGGDPTQLHLKVPPPAARDNEHRQAMVAIAAAAHSIDGFFGSVAPDIDLPQFKRGTARHAKIMEALKRGFKLGHLVTTWPSELERLFDQRDFMLHHVETPRPLAKTRETGLTIVYTPIEIEAISTEPARRAVEFALTVLATCLSNPKPRTKEWAEARDGALWRIQQIANDGGWTITTDP